MKYKMFFNILKQTKQGSNFKYNTILLLLSDLESYFTSNIEIFHAVDENIFICLWPAQLVSES